MAQSASTRTRVVAVALLAWSWGLPAHAGAADHTGASSFAIVEGVVITVQDVESALADAIRQRFYHRRPREEQLAALRQEVSEGLVNRILLVNEARRLGFVPDKEKVAADLGGYKRRVKDAGQWERLVPELTRVLEEKSIVAQLETATRNVMDPGLAQIEAYYSAHKELFTEPERLRVSIILIKVDPASLAPVWDAATTRVETLHAELQNGADFAELARMHSQDETAAGGGDVGYIHRGMLPQNVEELLDRLEIGSVSPAVRVLEGVALFRLSDRKQARPKPLETVRDRVVELSRRDEGDQRWRELIATLREKSALIIDPRQVTPADDARQVQAP